MGCTIGGGCSMESQKRRLHFFKCVSAVASQFLASETSSFKIIRMSFVYQQNAKSISSLSSLNGDTVNIKTTEFYEQFRNSTLETAINAIQKEYPSKLILIDEFIKVFLMEMCVQKRLFLRVRPSHGSILTKMPSMKSSIRTSPNPATLI